MAGSVSSKLYKALARYCAAENVDPAIVVAVDEAASLLAKKPTGFPPTFADVGTEEFLSSAEARDMVSAMTDAERESFFSHNYLSAKRRRKLTTAERKKMARRAAKLRRIRKYRSKVKKAAGAGMRAAIRLPGGKTKKVRKKYYVNTYDSQGNFLGSVWMLTPKPSKESLAAYKEKYGYKHPAALPAKDDKALARMKKK